MKAIGRDACMVSWCLGIKVRLIVAPALVISFITYLSIVPLH